MQLTSRVQRMLREASQVAPELFLYIIDRNVTIRRSILISDLHACNVRAFSYATPNLNDFDLNMLFDKSTR